MPSQKADTIADISAKAGEAIDAAREAAGDILRPADDAGAEEAAGIADRVDPGDARGRRRAGEEHRRHRPERPLGAVEPDRRDGHADERPVGARGGAGDREAERREQAGPEQVPAPLAHAVRHPAPHHHAQRAEEIGDHRHPPDLHVGEAQLLHHLRQEQQQAEARGHDAEIVEREQQHLRVPERARDADLAVRLDGPALAIDLGAEPRALVLAEPARLGRPVGQIDQHHEADKERRHRLGDEHPFPAGEAQPSVELEEPRRHRRAGRHRHWQRQGEPRHDAAAMPVGKPVGEIEDDAGKEPGLGDAQQKPHGGEAPRPDAEGGEAREQAPGQHDPRDPQPRADFLEDDVARHLEDDIAPEEGARRHAVDGGIEPQLLVHGEGGKADIDAVEITQEICEERDRQDAPIDLAHGLVFERVGHRFLPGFFRPLAAKDTDLRAAGNGPPPGPGGSG